MPDDKFATEPQQSPRNLQEQAEIGGERLQEAFEGTYRRVIAFRQSLTASTSNLRNFKTGGKRIILAHEQCAEKRRSALKSTCSVTPSGK